MLACLCSFQMDHSHPLKKSRGKKKRGEGEEEGRRGEENSKASVDRIKAAAPFAPSSTSPCPHALFMNMISSTKMKSKYQDSNKKKPQPRFSITLISCVVMGLVDIPAH